MLGVQGLGLTNCEPDPRLLVVNLAKDPYRSPCKILNDEL